MEKEGIRFLKKWMASALLLAVYDPKGKSVANLRSKL